MRELVSPPNEGRFNLELCAKGYHHGFALDIGDINEGRVGTWGLHCDGSGLDGRDAGRCPPQRSKVLLNAQDAHKLRIIRDDYQIRNEAVNKFVDAARDMNDALAMMSTLKPNVLLPPNAGNQLSKS